MKTCENCACNLGKKCIALNTKIKKDCFAWADKEQLEKRLYAIKRYRTGNGSENRRMLTPVEKEIQKHLEGLK